MLHDLTALTHAEVIAAFDDASDAFLTTVRSVVDWEAPGLGEWTVRELTGHTMRAYTTIETYLAGGPLVDADIATATDYFRIALSAEGIHEAVAQRGREAAVGLDDPPAAATEVAARVLAVVHGTDGDRIVESIAGRMHFTQYLATRVVELGIHTTDIQAACGFPVLMPATAADVVLRTLLPLRDSAAIIRALTGRGTVHVLG